MHSTSVTRGLLLSALIAALPQMALAQQQGTPPKTITAQDMAKAPDATIDFEASQFRLILGGGSGEGNLRFKGKSYPFTMKAGSVGGAGYTDVKGTGDVRFLKQVEDFAGTYTGVGAGAALGESGKGASTFQNQKGVVVSVRSTSQGAALNMGASGIVVTLKK